MNQLVIIETKDLTPAIFSDHAAIDKIVSDIETKVRATPVDISTPKGRKECGALAYKIARSKTALDSMGKELVAGLKAQSSLIDVERAKVWDRLEALQAEVRKPLTDWEAADERRIAAHQLEIQHIIDLGAFDQERPSSIAIGARLAELEAPRLARDWQEFSKLRNEAWSATFSKLTVMKAAAIAFEAEQAELERQRTERVAREQKERDDRIAAEAAAKALLYAQAVAAREAEEVAGRAKAALQAADDARQAAMLESVRVESERREAQLRAENAEAARVEQAAQAERDRKTALETAERNRLAAIETERRNVAAEAGRIAAETAAREADKKHRAGIHNEVLLALIDLGVGPDIGKGVVVALAKGAIPHTKIAY